MIPHEFYDEKSKNRANDIGLIRLSGDVTFSDFIRPICLPSSVTYTRSSSNENYVSVGWGRTLKGRLFSPLRNSHYSYYDFIFFLLFQNGQAPLNRRWNYRWQTSIRVSRNTTHWGSKLLTVRCVREVFMDRTLVMEILAIL